MERKIQLTDWAIEQVGDLLNLDLSGTSLSVVSGDASFRRYFRLTGPENSWICVDSPPDKEDNPRFVAIAKAWKQQGVNVPHILAADFDMGFMLLEDFGDDLLWPALHNDKANREAIIGLYRTAIDELHTIQSLPTLNLPKYDLALLQQELSLFTDWLCQTHLGMTLSNTEQNMFEQLFQRLTDSALSQPKVVVHRDYHSRNLMLCQHADSAAAAVIGVIDFQDAVTGPLTYDLASLLRDCYVRWPYDYVEELLQYDWQTYSCKQVPDYQEFKRDFDWMGIQRHMKAAGIFARLNHRDGKHGYLKDIPNTCQYILEVVSQYAEFAEFQGWLEQRFFPALNAKNQQTESSIA